MDDFLDVLADALERANKKLRYPLYVEIEGANGFELHYMVTAPWEEAVKMKERNPAKLKDAIPITITVYEYRGRLNLLLDRISDGSIDCIGESITIICGETDEGFHNRQGD